MKHIVNFSSGVGSWMAAKRVAKEHGTDDLLLVFADTKIEDADNYRFLDEAAKNVGGELVWLREGRDPWQVFHDVRFLGNSRIDPCSRILKRELIREWIDAHFSPDECTIYIGIDWTEQHRFERAKGPWEPYTLEAPMCDRPYMDKAEMLDALGAEGIEPPRLYAMGFPHANCGGFCIKAGQAHFANLLRNLPARYAYHERKEEELSAHLGKPVAVLKHRSGPKKGEPLPLKELRERIQAQQSFDMDDWGGCGCFFDTTEEGGK